ncbi:MAG TPA: DNA alkylation repair protein [candidate division Zixibacteria bacterium]|nr:DNA alkylation repair protein [candidate division Zixibacteria bacterium]
MSSSDIKNDSTGLWKDEVNRRLVERFADEIAAVYSKFSRDSFIDEVFDKSFQTLELKQRIDRIANCLGSRLPLDFKQTAAIIVKLAPKLRGFGNWILTRVVEERGRGHFDLGMKTLRELTKHGSSEFAVRSFVKANPERALKIMTRWARDKNEHVRRLAAEGSRPRGVWVAHIEAFREDPGPVIELIDLLRDDPSLYVRKAVANNLNDISRDHPDRAIATALCWQKDNSPRTDWIIKHGCRTLIKTGYPPVFELLGFTPNPRVKVERFDLSPADPIIGAKIGLTLILSSAARKSQRIVIDYRVTYARPNGRSGLKVFKWSEKELPAGGKLELVTSLSLRDHSTRKHHPGKHKIDLMINGVTAATAEFTTRGQGS